MLSVMALLPAAVQAGGAGPAHGHPGAAQGAAAPATSSAGAAAGARLLIERGPGASETGQVLPHLAHASSN